MMALIETSNSDDYLELPSCLESLVSSCKQLQHLAQTIEQYYIKNLLLYGYSCEPTTTTNIDNNETAEVGKREGKKSKTTVINYYARDGLSIDLNSKKQSQSQFDYCSIIKDEKILKTISSIVDILPILNKLNQFIEGCFETIESTLKRISYYLTNAAKSSVKNKNSNNKLLINNDMSDNEDFQLPSDTKLFPIYISIMDLIYSIVSLERVIINHTNICDNLELFKTICKLISGMPDKELLLSASRIIGGAGDKKNHQSNHNSEEFFFQQECEDLNNLPKERLNNLIDFVASIQLTLCKDSLFKQCLEHLKHLSYNLSISKICKTYKTLDEHFEEFILFFGEHLIDFDVPLSFKAHHHQQQTSSGTSNNNINPTHNLQQSTTFNLKSIQQAQIMTQCLIMQNLIPSLYIMSSKDKKLFGLTVITLIYSYIFRKQDKKVYKMLAQLNQKYKKLNFIHLLGSNSYIHLNEFIHQHLDKETNNNSSLILIENSLKFIKQLDDYHDYLLNKVNFSLEYDKFNLKVLPWLIRFKSTINQAVQEENLIENLNNTYNSNYAKLLIDLLYQGMKTIEEINCFIKSAITIYLHNNKPILKNNLIQLFRLVSLAKSIEALISENKYIIDIYINQMELFLKTNWEQLLYDIQKRLLSLKYSDRKLNTISILLLTSISSSNINLELLNTNNNFTQQSTIVSLCIPMLLNLINLNELIRLNELMNCLKLTYNLKSSFSYLYWNISTFGTYYNNAIEDPPSAFREISYFHMAINEIPDLFKIEKNFQQLVENKMALQEKKEPTINNVETRSTTIDGSHWSAGLELNCEKFLSNLEDELMEQFEADFLDKICQEFEIELRLQTHSDLNLNDHNPFRRHIYNFKHLLSNDNNFNIPIQDTIFRLFNKQISLKNYLELHLNRVCYNLTAISPNDWFTYDSMINLAKQKYNLTFIRSQLPAQTLDYGLDLLEITRNLGLFISRYSYDLTNQLFIEKCSLTAQRLSTSSITGASIASANATAFNQNLNVVQLKHIAKSIQTHGYGLLNSSVNQTYQVMKKLINLFAKQLADDKLRAVLIKEQQQLRINSVKTMTFDRANKLLKKFRQQTSLTNPEQQQSTNSNMQQQQIIMMMDLDSLRQLITQLGNLLGFIRMLKGGALHLASKSVDYLPDNNSLVKFEKLVRNEFPTNSNENETTLIESLTKAAENFDLCLEDFNNNFLSKTNYFHIIVDLFTKILSNSIERKTSIKKDQNQESKSSETGSNEDGVEFETQTSFSSGGGSGGGGGGEETKTSINKDKNADSTIDHLKLFYLIVPTLTINFVDYVFNCKERVSSRSATVRLGALLTDDGFSMGIAFLLTVLNQRHLFDQLEWFQQVNSKLENDKKEIKTRVANLKSGDVLKQTSSMTLKRLEKLGLEFNSLRYTLHSALLFFKTSSSAYLMETS